MEHYLPISILNDFIFCPYSIYLHQIYDAQQEELYHSIFQSRGKRLHNFLHNDTQANNLRHAFVVSNRWGIYGRIDEYIDSERELIEYKSSVATPYKGYYYQIWAQYVCLSEMGVRVDKLAFFDLSTETKMPIPIPTQEQLNELYAHIERIKYYDFSTEIIVNPNKCKKCIYFNLCERCAEE